MHRRLVKTVNPFSSEECRGIPGASHRLPGEVAGPIVIAKRLAFSKSVALEGDRLFALLDAEGKYVNGKREASPPDPILI